VTKKHTIELGDFIGFEVRQIMAGDSTAKKSLFFTWKEGAIKYLIYKNSVLVLETDMITEAIEKYNEL
jgi:hypothetical protein